MELPNATAEQKNGKLQILAWLDSQDATDLQELISWELDHPRDPDNNDRKQRMLKLYDEMHEAWTKVRPS